MPDTPNMVIENVGRQMKLLVSPNHRDLSSLNPVLKFHHLHHYWVAKKVLASTSLEPSVVTGFGNTFVQRVNKMSQMITLATQKPL